MSAENGRYLDGIVDQFIRVNRFGLKGHEFKVGPNSVNLNHEFCLPPGRDTGVQDSGCGIYAVYHAGLVVNNGEIITLRQVEAAAIQGGATPEDGMDYEQIIKTCALLELCSKKVAFGGTLDIKRFADAGFVVVANVWENWDRYTPAGDGGHHILIPAVDQNGKALVMDSSLRERFFMEEKARLRREKKGIWLNSYGLWILGQDGYRRIGYDCQLATFRMTSDDEAVYPGANWYQRTGVVIGRFDQRDMLQSLVMAQP